MEQNVGLDDKDTPKSPRTAENSKRLSRVRNGGYQGPVLKYPAITPTHCWRSRFSATGDNSIELAIRRHAGVISRQLTTRR